MDNQQYYLNADASNTRLQQQSIVSQGSIQDQGKADQADYNLAERGGGIKLTSDESSLLKKESDY